MWASREAWGRRKGLQTGVTASVEQWERERIKARGRGRDLDKIADTTLLTHCSLVALAHFCQATDMHLERG